MANTDKLNSQASDNFRLARSQTMVSASDGTYNLIRLPVNAFVMDVWLYMSTAYSGGSPSITIGWLGNGETAQPAGFMTNLVAKPLEAGIKRAMKETLEQFPGKYFNAASGMVTATLAADTGTGGIWQVLVHYSVIV